MRSCPPTRRNEFVIINTLLASLTIIGAANFDSTSLAVKSEYDKWRISVSIHTPTAFTQPRGVVILLPGTDGIAEPDLLSVFSGQHKKGQLNAIGNQVIKENFAYVTFNTRGIKPIETCLMNKSVHPKIEDFKKKCIDYGIRKTLNFRKIERDIVDVINALRELPMFQQKKFAVIAVSEGGIHASRLIRSNDLKVDALIGIGIPTSSPSDHFRDQISQNVTYKILRRWMIKENLGFLELKDLDKVLPIVSDITRDRIAFLIGLTREGLSLDRLEKQSHYMYQEFDARITSFTRIKNPDAAALDFFGHSIKKFVSGAQNQDFLNDKVNLKTSLANFKGNLTFLYGEYDSLVLHDEKSVCDEGSAMQSCTYHVIPQTGHVLLNSENKFATDALAIISKTLNDLVRENGTENR